jgi:hypothetical protein
MIMDETALFNRYGRSVYRVCGNTFYDYVGKPRGFLVGKTVYDLRGQPRAFYLGEVLLDRMGRIVGYTQEARSNGVRFPLPEIPPVPYRNFPAPEMPSGLADMDCPREVPAWSMMRLENLLV